MKFNLKVYISPSAEQRKPTGKLRNAEKRVCPQLGHRLAHEDSGERRTAGEMPGEERLVPGLPIARCPLTRAQVGDLGKKQKGVPVRDHLFRRWEACGHGHSGPGRDTPTGS